jgi:hypothetical protein
MSPTTEAKPIGLTELIYQVKRELLTPESRQNDPVPLFAVDEIELELAITVRREGQAGINVQVFSVGCGTSREDAQTVRVTLKPLRSREELIADLKTRDPDVFASMTEDSLILLKGGQVGKQRMSWP